MLFRERQQVVICALAGAIVGGFLLFQYLPLRGKVKAVEQVETAQMLTIAKASAEGKQLPVLEGQLLKLQEMVANYEAGIPVPRNLGTFLRKVADLMDKNDLKEQVVAVDSKEMEIGRLRCIPIDVQCKGRLAPLFEFYKQLQRLDRLVRIERIELVNDSDFSGEVSMQTKLVIYYKPEAG